VSGQRNPVPSCFLSMPSLKQSSPASITGQIDVGQSSQTVKAYRLWTFRWFPVPVAQVILLAWMEADMYEIPEPQQNLLLAALPADVQGRLFPCLERVPVALGQVLYEPGDVLRHVYFPGDCIVSLLNMMEDGASMEVSVVGNEGVVGVSLFMGGESTSSRATVPCAGYAWRLPAQRMKDEFNRHTETMQLMLRYTQSLITQMSQNAACNRHHSIDQQLCRWLLMSLDRLPGNRLSMTQELIANMLGVRREGITDAAGKLQKLGVIEYSRGHITVVDRPRLEALSCECYAVVKNETDRLLPPLPGPGIDEDCLWRPVPGDVAGLRRRAG